MSILKKRFGNKQQIISKHMDALLNLETITSHNLKGLRHFIDKVESHVRGLRALDVPSSSYGGLLSSVLMNKLPPDVRLVVSRKVPEDEWCLDALMKVIDEEVDARERAGSISTASGSTRRAPTHRDHDPSTAASLFTRGASASCVYCDQNHSSASCKVVADVETRKLQLRKSGDASFASRSFTLDETVVRRQDALRAMDVITSASVRACKRM